MRRVIQYRTEKRWARLVVTLCDRTTVNWSLVRVLSGRESSALLTQLLFFVASVLGLKRCSMRKHDILPQQRIIGRPFCEVCKSQMWLACIEPDVPGHDRRTFECPGCPNVTVRIVKYRATRSSPPGHLDAWYSNLAKGRADSSAAEVQVRQPASPSDRNPPRSVAT